jgi:hypothetical protein
MEGAKTLLMDLAVEVTRLRFPADRNLLAANERCFMVLMLHETVYPEETVTSAASRSDIQRVRESVRFGFGVLVKPAISWGSRFRLRGRVFVTEYISGRDVSENEIAVG